MLAGVDYLKCSSDSATRVAVMVASEEHRSAIHERFCQLEANFHDAVAGVVLEWMTFSPVEAQLAVFLLATDDEGVRIAFCAT